MAYRVTIDAAGRLVIPKALRDRFGLTPGTPLEITPEEGALRLSPDRPEPRLLERDGFLLIDLSATAPADVDHREAREQRARALREYASKDPSSALESPE